jgi:hypothetical protein
MSLKSAEEWMSGYCNSDGEKRYIADYNFEGMLAHIREEMRQETWAQVKRECQNNNDLGKNVGLLRDAVLSAGKPKLRRGQILIESHMNMWPVLEPEENPDLPGRPLKWSDLCDERGLSKHFMEDGEVFLKEAMEDE